VKNKILLIYTLFFSLAFYTLINPSKIIASVLFQDNFDDGIADGWVITRNPCQGDWEVKDKMYGIKITGGSCVTETMPDDSHWDLSWTNYIIDVDMKFVVGTDKNLAWRYTDPSSWYDLHFMSPDGIHMQNLPPMLSGNDYAKHPISNGNTYHITVEVREGNFKLAIDGNYIIDFYFLPEDDKFPTGRVAFQASAGADPTSEVWFDNLVVTSIDEEPGNIPIVMLPGLGGSWNTSAMISGDSGGNWKKIPFLKVYDNLKTTFTDAGYTENDDYFEFYYDWRKNLDVLADEFKNYLENTVLVDKPPSTKVNLIGHSMGGMVARAYAQEHGEDKINEIVTTGSPHEGAIPAWQAWAGAETGDRWSWQWIVLQLYLQIHKLKYASPIAAVHSLAPGLNDLMPIFDFAKNEEGKVIGVTTMDSYNVYLAELKENLTDGLRNLLNTIAGADKKTVEWIKLGERSLRDSLLGKWPDGKPTGDYEYTSEGDLTVLEKSALIDETNQQTVNNSHVELVETNEGIKAIVDALGILATPAAGLSNPPRNPSLLFFLHSPADIRVKDPDGFWAGEGIASPMPNSIYSAEDDLLLIYDAQDGEYQIDVMGTGEGNYQLELGQLTESGEIWNSFLPATTSNNEIDTYFIDFDSESPKDSPLIDDATGKRKLEMVIEQLENLKNHVNSQSVDQNYKDQVINYINRILRVANKGLNYLEADNYSRGTRYVKVTMTGVYLLRIRNNNWAKSNNIPEEVQAYVSNRAEEIGKLALDSFVDVFNQSGETKTEKEVLREFKKTERLRDRLMKKLESFSGKNYLLGNAFELLEDKYQKAQTAFDNGDLTSSYAYILISRLLSLETLKLAR